jgi:hypothetical protein
MRQSSREGDSSESGRGRGRRYSTTLSSSSAPVSTIASFTTTTTSASLQDQQQQLLYSDSGAARSAAVALRSFSLGDSFVPHGAAAVTSSSGSLLLVPANAAPGTGAVLPGGAPPTGTLLVAVPPPPRPDSNMPLNLADVGRKRKSPEQPNALADAQSVREVWLNSQKKPVNIRYRMMCTGILLVKTFLLLQSKRSRCFYPICFVLRPEIQQSLTIKSISTITFHIEVSYLKLYKNIKTTK